MNKEESSRKEIHKAVRNVMFNDLHIDKDYITSIFKEVVKEKFDEYLKGFSFEHYVASKVQEAWNAKRYTRTTFEDLIKEEIAKNIKLEIGKFVVDQVKISVGVDQTKRCKCPTKINIDNQI